MITSQSLHAALFSEHVMHQWWISNALDHAGPPFVVSWILLVIGSIVIHELAHGWVAIQCGDDVPLHSGHMTANPFVHIPPMAWIMFVLVGFTWGLMPTNPYNYKNRYDDAKVAIAGPASNVLIAIICSCCLALLMRHGSSISNDALRENLSNFFLIGTRMNIIMAMFNMIPIPPLDGSRVLGSFFPKFNRLFDGERAQIALVVCMLGVMTFGIRIIGPYADDATTWMIAQWAKVF